jgi:hypothetical protein
MIMDAALGTNTYKLYCRFLTLCSPEGFNQHWDTILIAAKFGLLAGDDVTSFQAMRLDALSLCVPTSTAPFYLNYTHL